MERDPGLPGARSPKDIASRQLKEVFPELSTELIQDELKVRREFADAITLAASFESLAEVMTRMGSSIPLGEYYPLVSGMFDLLSRLHFRRLYNAAELSPRLYWFAVSTYC